MFANLPPPRTILALIPVCQIPERLHIPRKPRGFPGTLSEGVVKKSREDWKHKGLLEYSMVVREKIQGKRPFQPDLPSRSLRETSLRYFPVEIGFGKPEYIIGESASDSPQKTSGSKIGFESSRLQQINMFHRPASATPPLLHFDSG